MILYVVAVVGSGTESSKVKALLFKSKTFTVLEEGLEGKVI